MSKRYGKKKESGKRRCPKHKIRGQRKLIKHNDGKYYKIRYCPICENERLEEMERIKKEMADKEREQREWEELERGFEEADEILSKEQSNEQTVKGSPELPVAGT